MGSESLFSGACFGAGSGATDYGVMLKDPLVVKVAKVPAAIAATVGWKVLHPDDDRRRELFQVVKQLRLVQTLELAQVVADIIGQQNLYMGDDETGLTLEKKGDPVATVFDRNYLGPLESAGLGGSSNTTVTRFWAALTDYRQVLGRLKRRLATVVIFKEYGLKRELENADDPEAYLSELTQELYHSLGSTGIMVIDSQSDAEVLDLSLNNIERAVEPWQQMLLGSAGGLTEQQLWGGTKRSLGLSGIDEQSRRATAEVVDNITSKWSAIATYLIQEIAYGEGDPEWDRIEFKFNSYDASTLVEISKAQRQIAEADQISQEMGILSREEIRASRHGGDGLGTSIELLEER